MDDFKKDRANFPNQNKDNISEDDVITIPDNKCTHCTNNKLGYIRHSISQDLLPNVNSDGCSRCRFFDIGLEDTRSAEFWRACFTEFVGTLLLCFYHIAIIIFGSGDDEEPPLLHVSVDEVVDELVDEVVDVIFANSTDGIHQWGQSRFEYTTSDQWRDLWMPGTNACKTP